MRGRVFSFFPFFGFIFIVFTVLLCHAVFSLSMSREEKAVFRTAVHTASMSKKEKDITLPRVCTYVRYVSECRRPRTPGNLPRREAYMASELVSPEGWRRDS